MKKGLLITLSAGIIAAAFAFTANAQNAPAGPTFTFSVTGTAYAAFVQAPVKTAADKAQKQDFVDSRFRPEFKISNGTSEFNMRFEIDSTFGTQAGNSYYDTTNSVYTSNAWGAPAPRNGDQKSVEVAFVYMSTKVLPVNGLSLSAGIMPMDLGLYYSDNMGTLKATYEIEKLAKVSFGYSKLYEYVAPSTHATTLQTGGSYSVGVGQSHDANLWSVVADITAVDGFTITPIFTFAQFERNADKVADGAQFKNGNVITVGGKVKGKSGAFGLTLLGVYASGKEKADSTNGTLAAKHTGFAALVNPTFTVDVVTVGPFAVIVSGDDKTVNNAAGTDTKNMGYLTLDGIPVSAKMNLLEEAGLYGSCNTGATFAGRVRGKGKGQTRGYIIAGGSAEAALGIYKATVNVGYGQLHKKGTGEKKDLGLEIDFNNAIELSPGTIFKAEFGFLKAGKAYETATQKKNNAYAIACGMTQKL